MGRGSRRIIIAALIAGVACTGATTPSTSGLAPASPLQSPITLKGITFDVSCSPVAEALVDIDLPHPAGTPKVRAITGLWDQQAIAVLANDAKGCGVWTLGLAEGLTPETAAQITAEVKRGVENFGVTASPVPREP